MSKTVYYICMTRHPYTIEKRINSADGDRTSCTILVTQGNSVVLLFDSACNHE